MTKLTVMFVMAGCLHLSASSYSQTITLEAKNYSLKAVFNAIQKQTDYKVIYNVRFLERAKPVNISAKQMPLEKFLARVLTDQSLTYDIRERTILIGRAPPKPKPLPWVDLAAQQERIVNGKVTDEANTPLEGVTVSVKGTPVAVVTDAEGNYRISLPRNGTGLVFTIVGFEPHEITIGSTSVYNVVLREAVSDLDEVVVIGYGTQRKSDLTGSVVRVSMDEKENMPNSNVFQALSGAAAGVNVQGVGLAGGEPSVSIRGQTSLSANDEPLIVVDGIIYNGSIADINTADVESIDILKDASAAAVYGSRSANGVMIITTKRGRSEKPTFSFNAYYGYQAMTNNKMKVMDAEQYAIRLVDYYYQQALYNWYYTKPTGPEGKPIRPDVTNRELVAERLRTLEERENYLAGNSIDWVDEVTRIAPIQNYNLSLSQSTERSNYFVSGSYTDENGILVNDKFKRFTLRANMESKISDWLTFGLNTSYSFRDYSGLEADLEDARAGSPLADNHIGSPNYDMFLTGESYMPYPLNNLYVKNEDTRNTVFLVGRAKATIPWVEGLSYELNYSNTYTAVNVSTFYPPNTPDGQINKGEASKNPSQERNWIVNNILSYTQAFGDHDVNATALFSRENRHADSTSVTNTGFDNPVLGYNNLGLGTLPIVGSQAWEENSLSYMGRVSYTYKDRYLLIGTVRKDGFSGFAADRKFATFPSVSVGWVLSEEPFLRDKTTLYLKLRTSYGKNGNQGIGRYSSFSRMASAAYVYGSGTAVGVYPSSLGNANLGWETTSSFNVGIDFGFLGRRITGALDIYKARTTDVLVRRALPPAAGYADIWANIGAIDNRGLEFQLTSVNVDRALRWQSDFVFSLNRDKIAQLYGGQNDQDIGNSWFVGQPISAIYDFEMAGGLWTEEDLYSGNIFDNWYPGQFKYVDQNGDGSIDPSTDRKVIGREAPNFRFSLNNSLSYKNITLSVFINSIMGGHGFYMADNAAVVNVDWNADDVYRINATAVRPYWTPDNGVNNATGVYNTPVRQSGIYESRSFVRLQDISLGYRLNTNLLQSIGVEACQVYISGKNLYTWTNWSGWDPEVGVSDFPLNRNLTLGARLSF